MLAAIAVVVLGIGTAFAVLPIAAERAQRMLTNHQNGSPDA
jgi:hypothetical protein